MKCDFSKHALSCKKKRAFKGWRFINAAGYYVDEDQLPVRPNRVTDGKKGEDVADKAPKPVDQDAKAWRKVKRSSVMMSFNARIREGAFKHFARTLNASGKGFSKEYLKGLIDGI